MKKFLLFALTITITAAYNLAFADNRIALFLSPDPITGPFYAIQVGGSALQAPMTIRLDTEGRTLIVPEGCVNKNNISIINQNVYDEWGNPAALVSGQITLTAVDGTQYTVAHLPFFMDKGQDCASGFKNFGVSMGTYAPGGSAPCAGNFFSYYVYPATMTPGFTIQAHNIKNAHKGDLIIGQILPGNYHYQLPHRSVDVCANNVQVHNCTGFAQWGTSIPNVTVTINSVTTHNQAAMLDTGGGMMIIRDNKMGTYANALQSVLKPCPASELPFLTNCQCLPAGQLVKTVFGPAQQIHYQDHSSNVNRDERSAVAICPNSTFTKNSPNPYVFPNGVNLGFSLFNYANTVSYNFDQCSVAIQQ